MKIHPMLFSTPMIQALLEGRKTQTRRVVKDRPPEVDYCRYQAGDLLWVRETFMVAKNADAAKLRNPYLYRADGESVQPWKPSIHMPRTTSRLTLEITGIRVERLQDISRGDCMAEGCPFPNIAKETNPIEWYKELWQSINGPDSWDANPWVWVVKFDVHKCNVDDLMKARQS